jgi:hypothetical protein
LDWPAKAMPQRLTRSASATTPKMPFLNTRNDLLFARPAPCGRIVFSQCTVPRARGFFPALQIPMPRTTSLPSARIPRRIVLVPRPSGEETRAHFHLFAEIF